MTGSVTTPGSAATPGGVTDKEYWDQYWGPGKPRFASYDRTKGVFHGYELLFTHCLGETRRRLGRERLRVLDCGSGEGLMLRFLHELDPDLDLTGIEYSDSIDKARALAESLGCRFDLRRGDLFDLCRAGRTGPFDLVMSLGLVEHFDDPGAVLERLADVLAPGGCLVTIIPSFEGPFNRLWRLYDRDNYAHHVPISRRQLVEDHRRLGLTDIADYSLGTPTIPGLHDTRRRWQKLLRRAIVQVNGRVLQRLWPRQASLETRHVMVPTLACVGWKPVS